MNLKRHFSVESIADPAAAEIEALAKAQPYLEPWIGYDFDKVLVRHDEWQGVLHHGEPIKDMIDHLKHNLSQGIKCKVFTARVSYQDDRVNQAARKMIQDFMFEQTDQVLEVTNVKDMGMRALYDDRAWHVEPNKGIIVGYAM